MANARSLTTYTVVSTLSARQNFGRLLDEVEREQKSIIIEKRGAPKAVLVSLRDYVRLAAPEPEILRLLGEEAERSGAGRLSARQIDQVIGKTRTARRAAKK